MYKRQVSNSGNATSVTAATHDPSPLDTSSQDGHPVGLRFNDDGTNSFFTSDSKSFSDCDNNQALLSDSSTRIYCFHPSVR